MDGSNHHRKFERVLWRATLGISNRKGSEDRLELALSLLELAEHASKPVRVEDAKRRGSAPDPLDAEVGDSATKRDADLFERLSGTLGKMLIPMLSTSQRISARKEAERAAGRIKNVITSIQSATRATIARWKTSRPEPGSNHPGAIVWEMQLAAKEIFRETRKRPTKRQIRRRLDDEGWRIDSKDAPSRWAERFKNAGLADLQDWAPP